MTAAKTIDRLNRLIDKGQRVLATHTPNPPGVIGFPTLDSGAFLEWRNQSLVCLTTLLGVENTYAESFSAIQEGYRGAVEGGIGILRAVKEDLAAGNLDKAPEQSPIAVIEQICTSFHRVARQLRARHANRPTLDVQDEYDLQDLMHALLVVHFADVRPEEYNAELRRQGQPNGLPTQAGGDRRGIEDDTSRYGCERAFDSANRRHREV